MKIETVREIVTGTLEMRRMALRNASSRLTSSEAATWRARSRVRELEAEIAAYKDILDLLDKPDGHIVLQLEDAAPALPPAKQPRGEAQRIAAKRKTSKRRTAKKKGGRPRKAKREERTKTGLRKGQGRTLARGEREALILAVLKIDPDEFFTALQVLKQGGPALKSTANIRMGLGGLIVEGKVKKVDKGLYQITKKGLEACTEE